MAALGWLQNLDFAAGPAAAVVVEEVEESPSGGWAALNYYSSYLQRKREREKERKRIAAELAALEGVDRQIARIMHKDLEYEARDAEISELEGLVSSLDVNAEQARLRAETTDKLASAFTRAYMQSSFSALESFERQMEQHLEEEEFLLLAILLLE